MITSEDKLIAVDLNKGEEYWTFKEDAERDYVHSLFAYPAMMVPKMQREILDVFATHLNREKPLTIFDPFMGSGTIMVEGMLRGYNIIGVDINPLAYLVVKTKTTVYSLARLKNSIKNLIDNLGSPIDDEVHTNFNNINKWFKADIIRELDHIKKQVMKESCLKIRRFMWVAFSDTVRTVSNSRSCTYKLYIKQKDVIENFDRSAIDVFEACINSNYNGVVSFQNKLKEDGRLEKTSRGNKYIGIIDIRLANTLIVSQNICKKYQPDIIVTSPPYGDNHTTVTYGQYSVLALRWINLKDISKNIDESLTESLTEIDRISMGGKIQRQFQKKQRLDLCNLSTILEKQFMDVEKKDSSKVAKIVSFYSDFDKFIACLESLNIDAYVIMTVGNRTVAKEKIKMDEILTQLFACHGFDFLFKFSRRILNKRMSIVNAKDKETGVNFESMNKEYVLILKKR